MAGTGWQALEVDDGDRNRDAKHNQGRQDLSSTGAAVAPIAAGLGVAVALGAAATVGSGVVGTVAVEGAVVAGTGAGVAGTGAGVSTSTYISTCDA